MVTDRPFLTTSVVTLNFIVNILLGIFLKSTCNYVAASLILFIWLIYKSNINKTYLLNFCLWNFYVLMNIFLVFTNRYISYEMFIANKSKVFEDFAITYTIILIIHVMLIIAIYNKG